MLLKICNFFWMFWAFEIFLNYFCDIFWRFTIFFGFTRIVFRFLGIFRFFFLGFFEIFWLLHFCSDFFWIFSYMFSLTESHRIGPLCYMQPSPLLTQVALGCRNYIKPWGEADLAYHWNLFKYGWKPIFFEVCHSLYYIKIIIVKVSCVQEKLAKKKVTAEKPKGGQIWLPTIELLGLIAKRGTLS